MRTSEAIQNRRSIKRFTDRPVTRAEIETLIAAATLAPNHRLTQPWRFYVLGPEARYAYGLALGERKAKKIDDPTAARAMRETVAAEHRALPCMIAVATVNSDNPETREEDYAAVMMAVQNLVLAAMELGLGTHIKTGGVMTDPTARAAAGVGEAERIVAVVNVGESAEQLTIPTEGRMAFPALTSHWSSFFKRSEMTPARWEDPDSRCFGFQFGRLDIAEATVLVLVNGTANDVEFKLPAAPGGRWTLIIDSATPAATDAGALTEAVVPSRALLVFASAAMTEAERV